MLKYFGTEVIVTWKREEWANVLKRYRSLVSSSRPETSMLCKPWLFPYHDRLQPWHVCRRPWSLHWRRSSAKLFNHRQFGLGGTLLFQISSSTHWHGPGHASVTTVLMDRKPMQTLRSKHPTLLWQLHEDMRVSQPLLSDAQLFPASKYFKPKSLYSWEIYIGKLWIRRY